MTGYQKSIEASSTYKSLMEHLNKIVEVQYGVIAYMLVARLRNGDHI